MMFSMLEVLPVLSEEGFSPFSLGLFSFASYWYFYQYCVSPGRLLSNKLGFVEFGVRLQKLCQFWCSEKAAAVLPRLERK